MSLKSNNNFGTYPTAQSEEESLEVSIRDHWLLFFYQLSQNWCILIISDGYCSLMIQASQPGTSPGAVWDPPLWWDRSLPSARREEEDDVKKILASQRKRWQESQRRMKSGSNQQTGASNKQPDYWFWKRKFLREEKVRSIIRTLLRSYEWSCEWKWDKKKDGQDEVRSATSVVYLQMVEIKQRLDTCIAHTSIDPDAS